MNPKQRSRGRGNNGGNPNRGNYNGGGGHGGGGGGGGGGGPRHINVRTQVFDSNGPEGRIRGNAHQVMEKYLAMARDASSQGDRVMAENFYQHAEHYFRLINAYNQNNGQRRPQNLSTPAGDQAELGAEDGEGEDQQQGAEQSADGEAPVIVAQATEMVVEAQDDAEPAPRPQRERAPRGDRPDRPPRGERAPRAPRAPQAEFAPAEAAPVEAPTPVEAAPVEAAPATTEQPEAPRERAPRRRTPRAAAPAPESAEV